MEGVAVAWVGRSEFIVKRMGIVGIEEGYLLWV